jgi:hypothetical protein
VVATKWGPAGTAPLFDRLNNKAELMTRRTIKSAEMVGNRARLILNGAYGVEILDTDAMIAGTGFKADIDRLTLLSASMHAEIVREGCAPKLSPGFETSVQNLHSVGILSAPTFGPVMRFMFGAKTRRADGDLPDRVTVGGCRRRGADRHQRIAGEFGWKALKLFAPV